MPSSRALSVYQRCGDRVAALHRLDQRLDRLVAGLVREVPARDPGVEWRSRSSTALSASSVFNTNARVRSPGSRPAVTASAAVAAHVAVGRVQPAERGLERGRLAVELDVIADTCSSNSRTHALAR